jgi:chaperone modulatory protein CbpM
MIGEDALLARIERLTADALRRWIDLGWVLPVEAEEGLRFDDSDVARVRLICQLHVDLEIREDAMALVLPLLDQVYDLRRSLRRLTAAVEAQPEDIRAAIAARLAQSS